MSTSQSPDVDLPLRDYDRVVQVDDVGSGRQIDTDIVRCYSGKVVTLRELKLPRSYTCSTSSNQSMARRLRRPPSSPNLAIVNQELDGR